MVEVRVWLWAMDVIIRRVEELVVSSFHHQWQRTMPGPTPRAFSPTSNAEAARMVMVGHLREILIVIGGNKATASLKCKNTSHQWATSPNPRIQVLASSNLVIESEAL